MCEGQIWGELRGSKVCEEPNGPSNLGGANTVRGEMYEWRNVPLYSKGAKLTRRRNDFGTHTFRPS